MHWLKTGPNSIESRLHPLANGALRLLLRFSYSPKVQSVAGTNNGEKVCILGSPNVAIRYLVGGGW